jgi:hypothetical protein
MMAPPDFFPLSIEHYQLQLERLQHRRTQQALIEARRELVRARRSQLPLRWAVVLLLVSHAVLVVRALWP